MELTKIRRHNRAHWHRHLERCPICGFRHAVTYWRTDHRGMQEWSDRFECPKCGMIEG